MDRDSGFSSDMGFLNVAILLIIGLSILIMIRILCVIYRSSHPLYCRPAGPLSATIVLGSEMLILLAALQIDRFKPRYSIASATDNMSLEKAKVLENSLLEKAQQFSADKRRLRWGKLLIFLQIQVGQLYITSVGTMLIALTHVLWLMIKIRRQVILCNGPGACIPLCVIAFFFKVFGIRRSSVFYVESVAHVRRPSLSGLLLYKLQMADQLFVQWSQLKSKYPRANYVGDLM